MGKGREKGKRAARALSADEAEPCTVCALVGLHISRADCRHRLETLDKEAAAALKEIGKVLR